MRFARVSVFRLSASVIALVSAAACASRTAPVPRLPAGLETCGAVLHDSMGPTPRTPEIGRIAADSGALVGTALDAQWGTGMAQVLIQLSGRDEARVATDSLGGFAFRALRPGRYVVRAVRLGADPAEVTTVVRAGRATEVALRLQTVGCRLE